MNLIATKTKSNIPKVYHYVEPDEFMNPVDVFVTEEYIIEHYFPYWSEQMKKVNKEHLINKENCIEDYIVVNWAEEVK